MMFCCEVLVEAEGSEREGDEGVQLTPMRGSILEALEMEHEHLGQGGQLQTLDTLHAPPPTPCTAPRVLTTQLFLLSVEQ